MNISNFQNVIATPVNEALKIEFKAVKILPDTFHSTEVAMLTFIRKYSSEISVFMLSLRCSLNRNVIVSLASKVMNLKQCSGKIVVKSKNNQFKLAVPYVVHLLHG